MYERTYGTEWEDLRRQEAFDRAFALGVAAACDDGLPEEFERVLATADGAYARSLIQLAYDEGRTKALEAPAAEDPEATWDELVDGETRAASLSGSLPGALSELTVDRKTRDGPPSSLELPSLLRK